MTNTRKEEPKQEVHHEPLMEKKPNMPKPSDELPAFKDIEIPKISMPTSTPSGPPPGMSMPPMPKMGSPTPKPTPAHSPLDDIHPELLRPSGVGVTREHAAAKVNHFMRLEDYQSMRDGIDNTKHNIEHKARINAKLNTIHQKIVTKQKTMQKNMDYMQKKFQWLDAKLR